MRMCPLCGFTDLYDDLWFHFCPLNGNYTSELEDIDYQYNIDSSEDNLNILEDRIKDKYIEINRLLREIEELEESQACLTNKLKKYKEDITILYTFI